MKKRKRSNIVFYLILFLALVLYLVSKYIKVNINCSSFEQFIFTMNNLEGTSLEPLFDGLWYVGLRLLIIIPSFLLIRYIVKRYFIIEFKNLYIRISTKKKNRYIKIFPINKILFAFIILFISIFYVAVSLRFVEYLDKIIYKSKIFEEEYVNPKDVNIEFKEKRNLIYIYVESLENSALSKENGGLEDESLIPNLEKLALDNVNFSNTDTLGGGYATYGSTWTIAGMVSQSAGIPLKVGSTKDNEYSSDSFLPGAYALGDILKDNGYKNYLAQGSSADFGGTLGYFKNHGDYEVYDYDWAKNTGLIPEDYFVWWGFEDKKLFDFSKDKLLEISKNDEPFNYTMVTLDSHFPDGYVDSSCETKFNDNYANSYYCTDQLISNFVNWVKEQDFYENTTIIISGDHLTMKNGFFIAKGIKYDRTVYHVIINSSLDSEYTKNRSFNTIDMYPTTIASLGGVIEGDRLGLGTNLFSGKETLLEKYGFKKYQNEISISSDYYNNEILKDDYIKTIN